MSVSIRGPWALLVAGIAVGAAAQVEPNAFLNRHAYTKEELKQQVLTDDAVADRYMRHFGASRREVVDLIDGLSLARLSEGSVFVVYNVPGWSELSAKARYLRKGTLVWQDATGRPILKASCGNPLVRGTDVGLANEAATEVVSEPGGLASAEPADLGLTDSKVVGLRGDVLAPPAADVSAAEFLAAAPGLPSAAPIGGGSGLGWLAIPGVIGGFALLDQGNNPPPIPEPATLTILGAAVALTVARRARRRD